MKETDQKKMVQPQVCVVTIVEAELFVNLLMDKARQIKARLAPQPEQPAKKDGADHANQS